LAKRIVEGVRDSGGNIGFRDLRDYEPIWRAPIKLRYGAYEIHTVAPPSGGGIVIGETLNILSADNLAGSGFQTPKSLHLILEAHRRAFIDRNHYVADPVTARIPYRDLLSQKRAEAWRKTIDAEHVIGTSMLTEPRELVAEGEHTTHFTIADREGNVVALTTTLGDDFGSGVVLPGLGFFLNNAMADFSGGANAIDPGKRAASSLSPVIVLRDGKPFLALGSRGGAAIPTTILQVFLNVVVYRKSLPDAVAAPRWHHQATPDEVAYEARAPKSTVDALNAKGHAVSRRESIGDVHAILFENGRLVAVADPRHGGAAGGL
jgi:gamma-glutamyltranspeptidase/glutathione hydrolase